MTERTRKMAIIITTFAFALIVGNVHADNTILVSMNSQGVQGNAASGWPSISADGRFVAFQSDSSNFVPNDNNGVRDIFVSDLLTHEVVIVSVNVDGEIGDAPSSQPSISGNGRYIAFLSEANNLVPGIIDPGRRVYVHDRDADENGVFDEPSGTLIELVSVDASGNPSSGDSPSISAGGRYVTFMAVGGLADNNTGYNIYVRDRLNGITELASVSSTGAPVNCYATDPMISADGRYVVFVDMYDELAPDQAAGWQVYLRDRIGGTTELVSVSLSGHGGDKGQSWAPSSSADGRYVLFSSCSTDLVKNDANYDCDVFLRDRVLHTTILGNVSGGGHRFVNGYDSIISSAGQNIAFSSHGTNEQYFQIFSRDVVNKKTELVSVNDAGIKANGSCGPGYEHRPAISADGRYVAFTSLADNLVPGDNNATDDVFVRVQDAP